MGFNRPLIGEALAQDDRLIGRGIEPLVAGLDTLTVRPAVFGA